MRPMTTAGARPSTTAVTTRVRARPATGALDGMLATTTSPAKTDAQREEEKLEIKFTSYQDAEARAFLLELGFEDPSDPRAKVK